jgi:predicted N-formylglutamate amidohydrolase
MNFLKNVNKALNKGTMSKLVNQSQLFRELTYREKQAVEVYDYRDTTKANPNNNLLITCEHASNASHKYHFSERDRQWLDTHWGYDIGAKDMGLDLAESAKVLSVFSNFSRLIIDPNRSLLSTTLVRKYVEKNIELEVNKEGTYKNYLTWW